MPLPSLPESCFEVFSKEIPLQRMTGFDDIETLQLPSGEDGGGIKIYSADKLSRVNLVEFKLGKGAPVPHHDNKLAVAAEVFSIAPDFSYMIPGWGINSIIMEDGTYYFDCDFTFGFDLVNDYEFTMKYLDPFNETYKKYCNHPDLDIVPLSEMTTWVRTYISPLFFTALTTTDKVQTVYELGAELIKVWIKMYSDAGKMDDAFRDSQIQRTRSRFAGMKDSDRMGKVLLGAYGKETFSKFLKAMSS